MSRTLLVVELLCSQIRLVCQDLVLRQLDEERGLPSNCVLDMMIDRSGYLWVGTTRGLYRYDGFGFEHIGAGTELDKLNVVGMFECPTPGEFLFSGYGYRLFHYANKVVRECLKTDTTVKLNDAGAYRNFCLDANGQVLMSLQSVQGVMRLDLHTLRLRRIDEVPRGVVVERYGASVFGAIHRCAVQNRSFDTLHVLMGGRHIESVVPSIPGVNSFGPMPVLCANGDVLVAYRDVVLGFNADGEFARRSFGDQVLGITEDREQRHWVRVNNQGVLCLDGALKDVNGIPRPFTSGQVTDVVQDARGGSWFSTFSQGLFYCATTEVATYSSVDRFGTDYLNALALDTLGRAYVGCSNGTVLRLENDGTIRTIVGVYQRSERSEVKGLVLTDHGSLYAGSLRNEYIIGQERLVTHREIPDRWRGIYDVAQLSDGRMMIGFPSRFLIAHGLPPHEQLDSVPSLRVMRFWPTGGKDEFWVATNKGLHRSAGKGLKPVDPEEPLLHRRTFDLYGMHDSLLLATDQGVVLLHSGKATVINPPGFPKDVQVRGLAMQNDRWLWCATTAGLFRLDRKDLGSPALRLGRSQGLPSDVVLKVAAYGDRIWCIAGPDLCSFRPAALALQYPPVPLVVLGVEAGGSFHPGATGHQFEHNVDHVVVALQHVDHARFGGPAFRYRQEGEQVWATADRPKLELVGLRPGGYRLEVQAADLNGSWGPGQFVQWTITAPFWQTTWFYVLAACCMTLAAGTVIAWVTSRRRREALLAAQAQHFHHRALLAQMEPHFLFNALNSIQGFVSRNDVDSSSRYLAKFAKLMRGLLNAAHNEYITLDEEVALLENYCALEALRTSPPFSYAISVSPEFADGQARLASFMVQPYVENAIRHGLRNLRNERAGHLVVRFELVDDRRIRCIIEDNGIGRAAAARITQVGEGWRSLGTKINAERVPLLMRMAGNKAIQITTEDLLDTSGAVVGTRVIVELPIVPGSPGEPATSIH
jgi:ligand-binding sensor domain-containing protein